MKKKVVLFFLIGLNFLLWNIVMPIMEPADESGHYQHVLFLRDQKRLPNLLDPLPQDGSGYTTYPPLSYALLVPLATMVKAPMETRDLLDYHPRRDRFKHGVFALYSHPVDELLFRWNRLMVAVHLLRFQNSFYGFLTVMLVFWGGVSVFGSQSAIPFFAAATVGFNPMFAHISNSVTNVNLLILLTSAFMALTVRHVSSPHTRILLLQFFLGVIAGAAYLTKITGLLLIPVWGLFEVSSRLPKRRWRGLGKDVLFFFSGFLVTAGWYLLRNRSLYGSWLEIDSALPYFGRPVAHQRLIGPVNYWVGFVETSFRTMFSGYGMVTVYLPPVVLFILMLVVFLALWGVLLSVPSNVRNWTKRNGKSTALIFLSLSGFLFLLGHIRTNMTLEAFHAKDLMIGIVPFALLSPLGWISWIQMATRRTWKAFLTLNTMMGMLLFGVIYFVLWQQMLVNGVKRVLAGFFPPLIPLMMSFSTTLLGFLVVGYSVFRYAPLVFRRYAHHFSAEPGRWVVRLSVALFFANILVLSSLVVPQLYRFSQ